MACPVHCHLFRSPWGCRAKGRMLCMSTLGFLDLYQGNPNSIFSSQWVHRSCHHVYELARSVNHVLVTPNWNCLTTIQPSIPTSGYDISIEPLCALSTYGIRWSPGIAQTVHPPVACGSLESQLHLHHCIPKNPVRMPSYGHISVFAPWHMVDEIE